MSAMDLQADIDREAHRKARLYDQMGTGYQIKELNWQAVIGGNGDAWYAETPASQTDRGIYIFFEEGKYWPVWNTTLPGFTTLAEAQAAGQAFHDNYIMQFLEPA